MVNIGLLRPIGVFMTATAALTIVSPGSPVSSSPLVICEVLEQIDRAYLMQDGGDGGGAVMFSGERIADPAAYEGQITPGNLYVEVFEPITEYGYTETYAYWVQVRPVELGDL